VRLDRLARALLLTLLLSVGCAHRSPRPPPPAVDAVTELEHAGVAAYRDGRYVEAREDFRSARELLEAEARHDLTYALVLQNLAEVERILGDPADAETLLAQTFAIRESLLPAGHPEIGRTLSNLGFVLGDSGKFVEAEEDLRRAITILEAALGPEHVDVAMPLANLSALLVRLHRCAEAEPLARRSLAIRERRLPPTHPDLGRSLIAVAGAIGCDPGRYGEAEPYYARAISVWEHSIGPDHPHLAIGLSQWAADAAAAERLAVAERLYARALRIQEARLPPGDPSLAATRRRYADVRARLRGAGTGGGEPPL
jgi:tetratricopeptide (TPR) repeat protein